MTFLRQIGYLPAEPKAPSFMPKSSGPMQSSGAFRCGHGGVPQQLRSGVLVGNAEIDLRDALIPAEGLDVRVWAYLGEVTVVVPPNIQVAMVATPLLGRVEQSIRSAPAGAPTVRIRALALFGDINVRTENPSRPDASA